MPDNKKFKVALADLSARMNAWFRGNVAFSLALRKGEDAKGQAIKEDDPYVDYVAWCFETGLFIKPVWDQAKGPAKAAIVAWVAANMKELIKGLPSVVGG
jgi:hypothetical protein